MSMVTKQEILEFWKKHETPEAKEERREVEALKKDLRIAQDSIQDAIARYRKAKLRARSKAKASSEDIFLPLEEYSSRTDIQDAYGYEMISETEYDIWDAYGDPVMEYDEKVSRMHREAERIAAENWRRELDHTAE